MRLTLPFALDENQRALLFTYGYRLDETTQLPHVVATKTEDARPVNTAGITFGRPITVLVS